MNFFLNSKTATASAISLLVLTSISSGVTVIATGRIDSSLMNETGTNLPDGSIVELGYFLGVDATVSPATYGTINAWDTFTVLRTVATSQIFNFFDAGADLSGANLDSDDTTLFPSGLVEPVRLGVRVYDSSTSTIGANFNTLAINNAASVLELPFTPPGAPSPDPTSGRGSIDISSTPDAMILFWEDNTSPFRTSIATIPEPSTSLSALLGLGLLIGARRRK